MNLLLRIIGCVGGLSFIGSGFGVLTDPKCSTATWGGHYQVTITCFSDSSQGGLPAWFAGSSSIFAEFALLFYSLKRKRR